MSTDNDEAWLATGTFLDTLNSNINKLTEAVERNTSVTQSLDIRLLKLEEKETARSEREAILLKRTFGAGARDWMTAVGDWLDKVKSNKVVLILVVALAVHYVPAMEAIITKALKSIFPGLGD